MHDCLELHGNHAHPGEARASAIGLPDAGVQTAPKPRFRIDRRRGKYSFNGRWALAARGEWIKSTGSLNGRALSLLHDPGSAWSLHAQSEMAEGSCVHVFNSLPGFRLGPDFNNKSQARGPDRGRDHFLTGDDK